jgi:hypothetical protein
MDAPDKKPKTYLQSIGEYLAERGKRAKERLKTYGRDEWNFAMVGLTPDTPDMELEGLAKFRKVIEPPGEIELSRALNKSDQTVFGAIGRYSRGINHELAISRNCAGDDSQAIYNFAWWLITAVRIRTRIEFLVPVTIDCSWSVVSAIEDNTCRVHLLEDVPMARRVQMQPVRLVEDDFRWAFRNALTFGESPYDGCRPVGWH